MKTYDEIQREAAVELNVKPSSVKTCWIASAKHELGFTNRLANNRGQGKGAPACPEKYRKAIQHLSDPARRGGCSDEGAAGTHAALPHPNHDERLRQGDG